jgi:hypothetical protein
VELVSIKFSHYLSGQKASQDLRVYVEEMVLRDSMETMALLDHKVLLEQLVHKVFKVYLEYLERQGDR